MKSNLERIYLNKDNFDILSNHRYNFLPNPFYLVNKFITRIDNSLNKNYLFNLKDLSIEDSTGKDYISNYDYRHNRISSSDSKSDVFALLHLASNGINKKYTGIITIDGVGYGLNSGITDYYTNLINGKIYSYPVEALIAKTLDSVNHKLLATSYFENNSHLLCQSLNIPVHYALDLLELVDNYHDNYIELIKCYREKFDKERFYHNEIYGKFLKEKNKQLVDLYGKIHELEQTNYILVDDIYWLLIDIIDFSKLNTSEKNRIIKHLNDNLSELFKKEQFNYLSNLVNFFQKTEDKKIKVMKLVK